MKNKKLIIVGAIIILVALGIGLKLVLDKRNSIEYIVQLQNKAEMSGEVSLIWANMHPEDKLRWAEREYIETFKKKTDTYSNIQTKSIKPLSQWVHPITGKSYSDVMEVLDTYTTNDSQEPQDVATHYAKFGGRWYFFSTFLSNKDREQIRAEAKQGMPYKELSKTPDKYTGQKVFYSGKVIQIEEGQNGVGFLRLDVGKDIFSEDVIYVRYSQSTDVLEGDTATVYGILNGSITYVSQANYNITVPYLEGAVIVKGGSI